MYCTTCGTKIDDGAKFCGSCGITVEPEKSVAKVEYFSISFGRLILLTALTGGLYLLYWFYKNWQAVKKAEGTNISPFWRAVFSIFFCYDLFKRVLRSAKSEGYTKSYSAGWLTTAYIALLFIENGYYKTNVSDIGDPTSWVFMLLVLLFLAPLPLLPIQRAINFTNKKMGHERTTIFTTGAMVLIVIGIILLTLIVLGAYGSSS
ncbi:MAG TPA: zinc ribbon domain-containing protein [Candidatus Nanoarchaeia archaeon]|nr:zinc ribbon domain-containing protein [Candidatus Nanoarchaeia archaeon]